MKSYLYSLSVVAGLCLSVSGSASDTSLHVALQSPAVERFSADVTVIADAKADIRTRFKHVRQLGNELSEQDIVALSAFAKEQGSSEQNLEGLRALKNEIFNTLRHQFFVHEGVTDTLVSIYEDSRQDFGVRDYALQHLGVWYQQDETSIIGQQREKIADTLYRAAAEKSSIAGTALLALHRISKEHAAVTPEKVNEIALKMARSSDIDLAARISAFQVCAERQLPEILPLAEALAQSAPSTPLRLSAISALSRLGGSSHITILTKLEANEDAVVRTSARKALAGLNSRLELF